MSEPEHDGDEKQADAWEALYEKIVELLAKFGIDNGFGEGDYFIVDDNYGWYRQHVEVHKLHIFNPEIIAGARALLNEFPEWQIVFQIDVPGKEHWPTMGLTIRKDEIIEVLQRHLLPEEFQRWQYVGGRPGTKYD